MSNSNVWNIFWHSAKDLLFGYVVSRYGLLGFLWYLLGAPILFLCKFIWDLMPGSAFARQFTWDPMPGSILVCRFTLDAKDTLGKEY